MTVTKLRQNLFKVLDRVLDTGVPIEIKRKGKKIRIVAVEPVSRLEKLEPHPGTIVGDPEDLVHMNWFGEWKP
jgi:prevent-host-death family protein